MRVALPVVMRVAVALCAAAACSCSKNTPTSATSTTTDTTTVAAPAFEEVFDGVVPVNGSRFYSFSVTQYGTVNVTLTTIGGAYVPGTVSMGLSLGTPSGEDCVDTSTATAKAGTAPQITGTYNPGVYCARIYDVGNLYAPADFSITIDYP